MAAVNASWLTKGYFVLRDDKLMCDVRDILQRSLRMPKGSLSVRMHPEEPNKWKHIVWWREGHAAYKEAQFFAQIARAHPVLSLGIAVEKGYGSAAKGRDRAKRMDSSWDWHRLVGGADTLLGPDVRALGRRLGRPLTLRITDTASWDSGSRRQAYSFVLGSWYHRGEGHADESRIAEYLREIDDLSDHWAIVHLACDLSLDQADGLTARDLASMLITFTRIRRRLKGQTP